MKHLLFSIALLTVSVVFAQKNNKHQTLFTSTYKAPVFTDTERMKKLEAAFPVVERMYKEYAAKNHFPGLAFGLVVDGKLVFSGGYGVIDAERKLDVSDKSLFRIASMTKSITAMAILKLRDEGKLRLDDPAHLYIPSLKKIKYLTADAATISIRHLMTHAAGFPEDNPWGDRQLADTEDDLVKLIEQGISNSNVPGIAYEYSNLGFAMLGKIITQVTGKPYQQYITETILKPLGMTHTLWEYTKAPADLLALGYRWQEDKWLEEPMLHDGIYGAMGGLITSIEDFSKYIALHQSAWPPRNEVDNGPVKRSSIREMHQAWNFSSHAIQFKYPNGRLCPLVGSYGYGLGLSRDCEGRVYVGHSGGLPGFGSQWRILPDYGIGVVAYGNLTYANLGTANWAILDTLITMAQLKPRQLPASDVLSQRKNELIKLLPDWNDVGNSKIFAENFFPDFSLEIRRRNAQKLFTKVGKIKNVAALMPENQLRGRFVMEGENANIEVFFTLTPENPALIQQLDLKEIPKK